jgi:hypothetical protein
MAQKQFNNYQDNILSFDLREAMLGVLKPGRYCGYDTFTHNSTGGGVINIYINHTTGGIQKGSNAIPPVLGNRTGVALTTQGLLIHDDGQVSIAIDQSASTGDRYDIIYQQHWFLNGTPGSNPATYGIKKGTAGAGTPTLDSPSKQVPLVLVKIPNTVVTFAGLVFTPYQSELGDLSILATIGNRIYAEKNYIADGQSLTTSINALDVSLKDRYDEIIALQGKKLDDLATPDDNTDLDASTTRHGLLKKLPNVAGQFMNGVGAWASPTGFRLKFRSSIPSGLDSNFNVTNGGTQDFDISSIVTDNDATLVLLEIEGQIGTGSSYHTYHFHADGEAYTTGFKFKMPARNGGLYEVITCQVWVKMASRVISITEVGIDKASYLGFKVIGWQTAL